MTLLVNLLSKNKNRSPNVYGTSKLTNFTQISNFFSKKIITP